MSTQGGSSSSVTPLRRTGSKDTTWQRSEHGSTAQPYHHLVPAHTGTNKRKTIHLYQRRVGYDDMLDEANPGMTCGAEFASHRALAMHRRRAHNWEPFLSETCCAPTAAQYFPAGPPPSDHLIRAYSKGLLPTWTQHPRTHQPQHGSGEEIQCRICHEWCTNLRLTPADTLAHTTRARRRGRESLASQRHSTTPSCRPWPG